MIQGIERDICLIHIGFAGFFHAAGVGMPLYALVLLFVRRRRSDGDIPPSCSHFSRSRGSRRKRCNWRSWVFGFERKGGGRVAS